jgi:AraC-like DNA-binding protein
MLLADTPSATASQMFDLYLSLHGFGLVGPQDVRELGLEPEQLGDLERRIPVAWILHLWQRAASRGARPEIGLLVGQQRGLHTRGPVAHLAAQSATLGEAIELFRRYIPVMSEGESLRVERVGVRVRIELLAEVRQRYAVQRLAQPGCTVEQLSRELGFAEPSAFYKAFKGWFGVSPKAYQVQR